MLLSSREAGEESEESELNWKVFISDEETKVNLSFPLGWTPGLHGDIQGGGPCGLVIFWDRAAKVYWVGSPVHDKWEKILEPCAFNHLQFEVRAGVSFGGRGEVWLLQACPILVQHKPM